jgi:hypothetical protein
VVHVDITVFWDGSDRKVQMFRSNPFPPYSGRHVPLKRLYLFTRLHAVASQKTVIFPEHVVECLKYRRCD